MTQVLDSLEKLLTFDEGKKLKAYRDSRGIWTIGIGHDLEANGMPPGIVPELVNGSCVYPACMAYLQENGITDDQCDKLFVYDIGHVTGFLNAYPWVERLDPVRQAAIHDMAFNLGERRFMAFGTFQGLMAADKFDAAADDLAKTAVFAELPIRYKRIQGMVRSGQWPVVA